MFHRNDGITKMLQTSLSYQVIFIILSAVVATSSHDSGKEEKGRNVGEPYKFGYNTRSEHGGQWRVESSDGKGNVVGGYGFTDENGLHREVKYVADENGFRVKVKTNEPGMTQSKRPAHVILNTDFDPQTLYSQPLQSESSRSTIKDNEYDYYAVYAVSGNTPPLFMYSGGHVQSPWFPMDTKTLS